MSQATVSDYLRLAAPWGPVSALVLGFYAIPSLVDEHIGADVSGVIPMPLLVATIIASLLLAAIVSFSRYMEISETKTFGSPNGYNPLRLFTAIAAITSMLLIAFVCALLSSPLGLLFRLLGGRDTYISAMEDLGLKMRDQAVAIMAWAKNPELEPLTAVEHTQE